MIESKLTTSAGDVSTILVLPPDPAALLVLGHGAGAGMRHASMEAVAMSLAGAGVGTLRYNFPYMEHGRGAPNRKPVLYETVRLAVDAARAAAPSLLLLAGGKSMGGRMTSSAAAEEPLPGVRGLVFYGFPLHPAGQPGTERGDHLPSVKLPMLFLQGTRDTLADLSLLEPICRDLDEATLHIVPTADHSFHVLKSYGKTDSQVLDELAATVRDWTLGLR